MILSPSHMQSLPCTIIYKKIKPPLIDKDDSSPWYHLGSRQRTSHTVPFSLKGNSTCVQDDSKRNNGRTRARLNLHRASSEAMFCRFLPAPSHQPGFSEGPLRRTLLFTAFIHCNGYYIRNARVLSTEIPVFPKSGIAVDKTGCLQL